MWGSLQGDESYSESASAPWVLKASTSPEESAQAFMELRGHLVGISTQYLQTWIWVVTVLPHACLLSAGQSGCLECKDEGLWMSPSQNWVQESWEVCFCFVISSVFKRMSLNINRGSGFRDEVKCPALEKL